MKELIPIILIGIPLCYIIARLVSYAIARSWWDVFKNNNQNNKGENDEE